MMMNGGKLIKRVMKGRANEHIFRENMNFNKKLQYDWNPVLIKTLILCKNIYLELICKVEILDFLPVVVPVKLYNNHCFS
jgi:hypothetical protein